MATNDIDEVRQRIARVAREARVGRDLDIGSYRRVGLAPIDFDDFHKYELPRRLDDGASGRIAWDVEQTAPLVLQSKTGSAYSYVSDGGRVRIVPGAVDEASLFIQIDSEQWINYVYHLRTRYGLMFAGAVDFLKGSFDLWDAWEPALRCLYSGMPIFDPSKLPLGEDGRPLDPARPFRLTDDRREMSHYLRVMGYLLVKQAYSPEKIRLLSDEIDRLRDASMKGTVLSHWATDGEGRDWVYDIRYLGVQSPILAALDEDPTVTSLNGLVNTRLVSAIDRDAGAHAVLQEFGSRDLGTNVSLGWHTDCGLGGCPITCPKCHVGVQLDAANSDSSHVFMLAGSVGHTCHVVKDETEWDRQPVVPLITESGDVTVHLGCTLHAASKGPLKHRRRTIYTRFVNPKVMELFAPFETYDQLIPGYGSGFDIPALEDVAQ